MKLPRTFFAVATLFFAAGIFPAVAQPSNAVASAPVYVPDYTHAGEPLPDGVIAWDALTKQTVATNGQDFAWFAFAFTNIAEKINLGPATNVTVITNFTTVTNTGFWTRFFGKTITEVASVVRSTNTVTITNSVTPIPVAILDARASCGCTQPQLPSRPWLLPPGTNSVLRISVDLAGKSGMVFKYVDVSTDKGTKRLNFSINILPPPPVAPMSAEERARGVAAAKIDRQAVFKGDCASCHVKKIEGKMGQALYESVCGVCHEANPRATMVPDLHNLKDPTSEEFWRTWITSGKAGTLMPAFATSQGGPLNDMQIASLAAYLNFLIPPHASPPAK